MKIETKPDIRYYRRTGRSRAIINSKRGLDVN
jgi:hypothetical protein